MRFLVIALSCVLGAGGCASDSDPELTTEQGPCSDLDEATCRTDGRCQQAYVDSGHQPAPFPLKCLLVEAPVASTAPCIALTKGECRARNDCTPMYWQDLGPDDGPVGDPYYQRCDPELSPE